MTLKTKSCSKSVCQDREGKFRHPKSCKFGGRCKFHKLKFCVYNHKPSKVDQSAEKFEILRLEIEALEDTIKAQSVIVENHENKIVEMDIIINNLTKIVEELKAEKECTDKK